MKTGKYGEPWTLEPSGLISTKGMLKDLSREEHMQVKHERRLRGIACVNALAGRDPAKLKGLVEACRKLDGYLPGAYGCGVVEVTKDDLRAIKDALAAFQGGGS